MQSLCQHSLSCDDSNNCSNNNIILKSCNNSFAQITWSSINLTVKLSIKTAALLTLLMRDFPYFSFIYTVYWLKLFINAYIYITCFFVNCFIHSVSYDIVTIFFFKCWLRARLIETPFGHYLDFQISFKIGILCNMMSTQICLQPKLNIQVIVRVTLFSGKKCDIFSSNRKLSLSFNEV